MTDWGGGAKEGVLAMAGAGWWRASAKIYLLAGGLWEVMMMTMKDGADGGGDADADEEVAAEGRGCKAGAGSGLPEVETFVAVFGLFAASPICALLLMYHHGICLPPSLPPLLACLWPTKVQTPLSLSLSLLLT